MPKIPGLDEPQEHLGLAQARAVLDDPPAHLRDGQKRRLAKFVSQYERYWATQQRERYDRVTGVLKETYDQVNSGVDEQRSIISEVTEGVTHGRMTSRQAYDRLSGVARSWRSLDDRLDGVEAGQAEAIAHVTADPADLERENAERFPSVPVGFTLTASYLDGDDSQDPFPARDS
jgi:hypothetical protein